MTAPALSPCAHAQLDPLPPDLLAMAVAHYRRLPDRFVWCPTAECGVVWYRWPLSGRLEQVGVVREGRFAIVAAGA